MKILVTLIVLLVLVVVIGLAGMYSGAYNVSTSNHDNSLVNWALDNGMVHSVQKHARNITAPPLTDSAMVEMGFRHYDEMCVGCHGAPGIKPGDIAHGLWPEAPDLAESAPEWTPAQIYWIIRNGLKFSSMPAWGPTHSDKELWAMTAFVTKLPHLSAAEYKAMQVRAAASPPAMLMH
ncbi:MAG: c-type cytochrome [Bacteroidota bacterium]